MNITSIKTYSLELSLKELEDIREALYTAIKALDKGNVTDKMLADRLESIYDLIQKEI